MRKKNKVLLFMLILLMSLGLTLPAGAASSTGTMEVNCAGARFQGTAAVGDTVQLDVRLHESDALSPKIQDDMIVLPEGPFDVFVPWVADPDGRFYRTAIRVNGAVIIVDEGTLDCQPDIDIEKSTNGFDADTPTGPFVPVGDPVVWDYVVTNTGNEVLVNLSVTDDILGLICTFSGPLAVGDSFSCSATGTAVAGQYANLGTVDGFGELSGDPVTDSDPSHYFGEEPQGGEGCTPGYWKNHIDSWSLTPYMPGDQYDVVFGVSYLKTLLEALNTGGGGQKALGRHAVAALLNASHPGVSFFYTPAEVIQIVQNAYFVTGDYEGAKNMLEAQNGDDTPCPIN